MGSFPVGVLDLDNSIPTFFDTRSKSFEDAGGATEPLDEARPVDRGVAIR